MVVGTVLDPSFAKYVPAVEVLSFAPEVPLTQLTELTVLELQLEVPL